MDLSYFERYRPLIDDWDAFAAALARPLPATIWTNTLRTTPERLSRWLAREGVAVEPIPWYPGAFRLPESTGPGKSLAYITGWYHVQEEAALIPIALLDPRAGERLLDMCAAPGNKAVQAAVRMDDRGTIIANERRVHRVGVIRRSFERLGITSAAVTVGDAANLPRGIGVFDQVLADVPCSCEGTTRKSPEVFRRLGRRKAPRRRPAGDPAQGGAAHPPRWPHRLRDLHLRAGRERGRSRRAAARISPRDDAAAASSYRGSANRSRPHRLARRTLGRSARTGDARLAPLQRHRRFLRRRD